MFRNSLDWKRNALSKTKQFLGPVLCRQDISSRLGAAPACGLEWEILWTGNSNREAVCVQACLPQVFLQVPACPHCSGFMGIVICS